MIRVTREKLTELPSNPHTPCSAKFASPGLFLLNFKLSFTWITAGFKDGVEFQHAPTWKAITAVTAAWSMQLCSKKSIGTPAHAHTDMHYDGPNLAVGIVRSYTTWFGLLSCSWLQRCFTNQTAQMFEDRIRQESLEIVTQPMEKKRSPTLAFIPQHEANVGLVGVKFVVFSCFRMFSACISTHLVAFDI